MSVSLAVVGALGGATMCAAAGVVGAKAAFREAVNDAQRHVLQQTFTCGGWYVAAVMGLVVLTAAQVLPSWTYMIAVVLWFGPLFPALTWVHHQLAAAAGQQPQMAASLSVA
jgi:hypothetical protein